MQQPEVRRAVYDGMPVLLAADPSVQVGGWVGPWGVEARGAVWRTCSIQN